MAPLSFVAAAVAAALPLISALPQQERSTTTVAGKRGLAYNVASYGDLYLDYPEVTWGYNWGLTSGGLDSQFEYVPMLWGDPTGDEAWIEEWAAGVEAAVAAGTTHLLAFNEPDLNGLSPKAAAESYMKYMQPYANISGMQLGAPAVTNGQAPLGFTWLSEFMGNCTECTIDFVPFHWYCGWKDVSYFVEYVEDCKTAAGGVPIWFTEFQAYTPYCDAPATTHHQIMFMETFLPWLDTLDYVDRYSYFGVFETSDTEVYMLDKTAAKLSKSGKVFAEITNKNTTTPTSIMAFSIAD